MTARGGNSAGSAGETRGRLERQVPQGTGPLAAIRRQFPGWRPWRSDAGRFWATRTGTRPARRLPCGWAMTVDGDNAADLCDAIREQEDLADTG